MKKRGHHKHHKNDLKSQKNKETEYDSGKKDHDGVTININITYNLGNKEYNIEQRAEGGGQINKNVRNNANQGGQNAVNRSLAENIHSNFANGNGRSGIAGDDNDEAGGQQGIKIRDSEVEESIIKSSSSSQQSESENTEGNP